MSFLEYAPAPESTAILALKPSYGLFIDGEFVDGSGSPFSTISPATEKRIAEIATAWLTMASDQDQLRISLDTLKAFERTLELTRAQFRIGVASELEAKQAETNYQSARNDIATAKRELLALSPADRAAVQPWLDKGDARDAALASSRQFAADAMAALTKPAP